MKYATISITTLLFLCQIDKRLSEIETGYVFLILTVAMIPSLIALFYKFKKDKQEGNLSLAKQGVSVIFIMGTMLFAVIQQFIINYA